MEKRYQVFVSSTYEDLQEERQEVMHALLELDCMPAGMELFPAANDSQWELIKKVIEDCDYYVLIIAGRYGTIGAEGLSYTEMEYNYAISIGKPTIAFLHKDPSKIIAGKSEATEGGKKKLVAFRESVGQKLCKNWSTAQELGSVVSRSLIQLIKSNPAVGWVRANELPDRDATIELLRMRRRVEELEGELSRARTSAPKGAESLAQGNELHTLHYAFEAQDPHTFVWTGWRSGVTAKWADIFGAVAPLMINEASDDVLRSALNGFVDERGREVLVKEKAMKGRDLRSLYLKDRDFQTIKVQLRALGLITKSEKPRSVKDSEVYWTLTPYGDEYMTRLMAIRTAIGEDSGKVGPALGKGE